MIARNALVRDHSRLPIHRQSIGFLLPAGSRLDGVHRATFIIM
jgi:hypothetical protein